MKVHERIHYKKAIFVYKSLNNLFPEYMSHLFSHTENSSLRSHTQKSLLVPKPRLEFCRKSLGYSGPKIWNQIPLHIRQSQSLTLFKQTYLSWWFSGGNLSLNI